MPRLLHVAGVEAAPPGLPIVFDFLTGLETSYRDWLKRPLPEQASR
jgi:acetone carboxylase gamma subunit